MTWLAGARRSLARRLSGEGGFTLIELLVAMIGGLAVAGAGMAFLITSIDQQNAVASRSFASAQAEVGLQQMVRDLRGAMYQTAGSATTYAATVATNAAAKTTSLTFDIPTSTSNGVVAASDAGGVQVTWTCPSSAVSSTNVGSCTRQVGSGSARPLIRGVQYASFQPVDSTGSPHSLATSTSSSFANPATVNVTLDLQDVSRLDTGQTHTVRGVANPIVLQTSADLRNFP